MATRRGAVPIDQNYTDNQRIAIEIADAIGPWPPQIDSNYYERIARAAAYLGNPVINIEKITELASQVLFAADESSPWGNVLSPTYSSSDTNDLEGHEDFRNKATMARNNCVDVVKRVNAFVSRAKNAGFFPPSNPFVRIGEINSQRIPGDPLHIEPSEADDLIANIGIYLDFLKSESEGNISLEKTSTYAAQLSSVNMSFEGFGGSGNAAVDLMRFLPDIDAVKRKRAEDALSVLNFKKRKPRVIATMDHDVDGQLRGSIIVFKKLPDASGYVIRRRNIFTNKEVSWTLTNDELSSTTDSVISHVEMFCLSFYSSIKSNTVFAFIDGSIDRHSFYVYTVQAYRTTNSSQGTLFSVPHTPFNMSESRKALLSQQIEELDPGAGESISPWPLISHDIYGTPDYDWLLAAVNTRASIDRGDPRSETRSFSYLSAQLQFIFEMMNSGKFVLPDDINQISRGVSDSINRFGVTQTLIEIFQESGVLFYFEGKDAKEDTYFYRVGNVSPQTSDIIGIIAASIDPENATVDLSTLASNLPFLSNGGSIHGASTTLEQGSERRIDARPEEIMVPSDETNTPTLEDKPKDEIQFLNTLGSLEDQHADLTTFEGISTMMRTIRIMSDVGGNRGTPIVSNPDTLTNISIVDGNVSRRSRAPAVEQQITEEPSTPAEQTVPSRRSRNVITEDDDEG